jgi:hypothetical protein
MARSVKKLLLAAALALVAYGAFGLYVRAGRASRAAPTTGEVRGAYHVHTTRSDGRGTLDEVVRAAKLAGLQFVVVTDHNLLTAEEQGYRDGVLVVEATEASTPFGHVVALGTSRALSAEEREGDPFGAIVALGGVAVLAHPLHPRRPFTGWGKGPWRGFEVVSNDTAWHSIYQDRAFGKAALAALELPWDGARAVLTLSDSPADELRRFDEELRAAPPLPGGAPAKVLLCSADAHGYPSYRATFEAFSMHLPLTLSGDAAADARGVLAALAGGKGACVFDGLAPGRLVRFGRGREAGTLEVGPPELFRQATAVLVRDGAALPHTLSAGPNPALATLRCEGGCPAGTYRLELRRDGRPWIFTNPVPIE